MTHNKTFIITICAFAAAMNIVLGTLVSQLQIPLIFLDTIGTIFVAIYFGPFYGATVGAVSNIITGIIFSPKDIPFLLVNVAVGVIVGYIAKKYGYSLIVAIITGIILSIICPLIGSPIAIWIYGGLTGSGNDLLVLFLRTTGADIFTSTFIPRISGNIVDKVVSAILVYMLIKKLPIKYKPQTINQK